MYVIPKIPRASGGLCPPGPLPGFYPGPAGTLSGPQTPRLLTPPPLTTNPGSAPDMPPVLTAALWRLCARFSDVIAVVGILLICIFICCFEQDWWYFSQICHCIHWFTDYCVNTWNNYLYIETVVYSITYYICWTMIFVILWNVVTTIVHIMFCLYFFCSRRFFSTKSYTIAFYLLLLWTLLPSNSKD
jgi:hypothetical protein